MFNSAKIRSFWIFSQCAKLLHLAYCVAMSMQRSVLVLDRDQQFLSLYDYLLPVSFKVFKVSCAEEAKTILLTDTIHLIICDDEVNSDLESLVIHKTFLNLSIPVILVSGAFYSTNAFLKDCFMFITKSELHTKLPELLSKDSPLWESDTIET